MASWRREIRAGHLPGVHAIDGDAALVDLVEARVSLPMPQRAKEGLARKLSFHLIY
jgi:hypothetical protein